MNHLETDMADETEKTTTEAPKTDAEETLEEQVEALKEEVGEAAKAAANVIERFFDVSFGAGAIAAEKLDANLRRLWDDGPGLLDELEQRGRPVREKIQDAFRGKAPLFPIAGDDPVTASSDDEITTLENRVKELEEQHKGKEPSRADMLELDASAPNEPKSRTRRKKTEESASE